MPKEDEKGFTGFGLFMLCHFFGRRGRATARSIARQEGCSFEMELTVFYSRGKDLQLLREGLEEGAGRPRLRPVKIPESEILKRALHFSRAHGMHCLSHTVFLDADLWFPQDFWKEYASAVRAESRGYWSCRVMNIPRSSAESFVAKWDEVTADELEKCSDGRRLDRYGGRVGHFQCIPRGLATYPQDHQQGVQQLDLAFAEAAVARSVDQRHERRISRVPAYHLDHPNSWEGTGGIEL